jgi:predicted dithiol-disulfide oxidoreductase (DUF899 family)
MVQYDLGSENREEKQDSTISVFTRDTDGTLRHFYSGHPWVADDIKERGIDELSPIWNVLDLTPQGRGTFTPRSSMARRCMPLAVRSNLRSGSRNR